MLHFLKQWIRHLDALTSRKTVHIDCNGSSFNAIHTHFWNGARQEFFDEEIAPYFRTLPEDFQPKVILDAGAHIGYFSVAAALHFPHSHVYAFEPSFHGQILIRRHSRANNMRNQITIVPCALWNRQDKLAFRTHGSISSIQVVGMLPPDLAFSESVRAVALDTWAQESKLQRLDLIKMDIEGAEIEALEGARATLSRFHPVLLLQAYHLRNGVRTLEPCAEILQSLGYHCTEIMPASGFLLATHSS